MLRINITDSLRPQRRFNYVFASHCKWRGDPEVLLVLGTTGFIESSVTLAVPPQKIIKEIFAADFSTKSGEAMFVERRKYGQRIFSSGDSLTHDLIALIFWVKKIYR